MTGNWLLFGIKKKKLMKKYKKFKRLTFPELPENSDLYDLYAELVALDGHIAGLVSSYLKGNTINLKLLHVDGEFNKLVTELKEKKHEMNGLSVYLKYKEKIDELIRIIENLEYL